VSPAAKGWRAVDAALPRALGMHFDGCHKIYLSMDDPQRVWFDGSGYENREPDGALLREWFNSSCSLRFVSAVSSAPSGAAVFDDLIPQLSGG